MNELYGVLDPTTRDWTDGLLSKIFREVNKPLDDKSKSEKRYILFDGDVDALWIENMNSVMDDNKLLTLANQERIRMLGHCSLLFEVIHFSILFFTDIAIHDFDLIRGSNGYFHALFLAKGRRLAIRLTSHRVQGRYGVRGSEEPGLSALHGQMDTQ